MRLLSCFLLSAIVTLGLIARRRPPRIALERFPSGRRRVVAIALLIAVLALTVFLPLRGLASPAGPADLDHVSFPSLFAAHAVLGAFLVGWWGLAGFPRPRRFLHFADGSGARRATLGFAAGLAAWAATIGAMALVATLLGLEDSRAAGQATAGGVGEIPDVVKFLVGLSVSRRLLLVASAAFFEEAFFRAFLQTRGGLLLSTILFTASHASYGMPFMLVGVFTVSLILGLLFSKTGDILPCMIAHGVFDGVQLLVILPAVVAAQ